MQETGDAQLKPIRARRIWGFALTPAEMFRRLTDDKLKVVESHYFIGNGRFSEAFGVEANDLPGLSRQVAEIIRECGLDVMSDNITGFSHGGATLVWVLAESHVVIHYWKSEEFVTIDIHVCDYTTSNAEKAARLRDMLQGFCFGEAECQWKELVLSHPERIPLGQF